MARAPSPGGPPPSNRHQARGGFRLPFWVLQTAELAIAFVLLDAAAHVTGATLLLLGAGALALLSVTAKGPLGLVRVCPQRLHVVLSVAVSGLLLAGLVVPRLRPDATGIVVVVVAAAGLVRLATLTRTDGGTLPAGSWPGRVIDATATEAHRPDHSDTDVPSSTPPPGSPEGTASSAPSGPGGAAATTDQLARQAGEAVAKGRRLARRHRPAVEASARRGIRSLGRAVGRMSR